MCLRKAEKGALVLEHHGGRAGVKRPEMVFYKTGTMGARRRQGGAPHSLLSQAISGILMPGGDVKKDRKEGFGAVVRTRKGGALRLSGNNGDDQRDIDPRSELLRGIPHWPSCPFGKNYLRD